MAVKPNDPKWLTDDELATWMLFIGMVHRLPSALDSQLRRDSRISHFEYGVLAALSAAPDHAMTMSEIADCSRCSLSRLSHVARRMEQREWIERSPLPTDGRITIAKLTKTGMKHLAAAAPGHAAEVRRLIFSELRPGQLKVLGDVSETILAKIGPCEPQAQR